MKVVQLASCILATAAYHLQTPLSLRKTCLGPKQRIKPHDMFVLEQTSTPSKRLCVEDFLQAWNERNFNEVLQLVDENITFEDASYASSFQGKEQLERYLRLSSEAYDFVFAVDDIASDTAEKKYGVLFHLELMDGEQELKGGRGAAFFKLDEQTEKIIEIFVVKENDKSGESNLKVLSGASAIIEALEGNEVTTPVSTTTIPTLETSGDKLGWFDNIMEKQNVAPTKTAPEKYFDAWNRRDMKQAVSVFAENVEYDDTAFPEPFIGKEALEAHLNICANALPSTFSFNIDDKVDGGDKALLRWHVENDGKEMPFTRGCSFYTVESGLIRTGIDFVEPAVFKTGGILSSLNILRNNLLREPIRWVPLVVWSAYIYIVFFSDWFFGLPATALEERTWIEVRDLSLNFFLVSPILNLPFAPVIHPMLEGVFNLLLSWAALFAGFLSDDRRDKPNALPMLPMVAGMQFLTSAFLLPYLVFRSNDSGDTVYREDLSRVARITENRLLGVSMATVGTGSILWGLLARVDNFGGWNDRIVSFLELLSIDRVGSSFLVDLAIFALFQGWFVNDDLKRRGVLETDSALGKIAKYVPFFGMAAYMALRPPLPSREEKEG